MEFERGREMAIMRNVWHTYSNNSHTKEINKKKIICQCSSHIEFPRLVSQMINASFV